MPLVKCPDCNTAVSDKAAACPKCNRPGPFLQEKKKKGIGCSTVILIFFGLLFVSIIHSQMESNRRNTAERIAAEEERLAKLTPEQRAAEEKEKARKIAEREKQLEQERKERTEQEAKESAARAAEKAVEDYRKRRVWQMTKTIRENARNPKSVEWINVYATRDGHTVCVVFRGQNGFGGMSISRYAIHKDKPIDGDASPSAYNKVCAGNGFVDMKWEAY